MKRHLERWRQKWLYSEDTYNILNQFTLDIKDKEIATEYELYRIKRFNGVFWLLVCIYTIHTVFGWVNYFFGGGQLGEALRPLQNWLVVIIILIPRLLFPRYTPYSWFLCTLPTHFTLQLTMRGFFSGQDSPRMLAQFDPIPIYLLIIHILGNFNTFRATIMVLPALHLVFYYLHQQVELEKFDSKESWLNLEEDDMT